MINKENWVVKSNALLLAKGNFTALERKVLLGLISTIKMEDEEFKEYEVSVTKMQEAIESKSNAFYEELKNACEKLISRTITIERELDIDDPKKLKKKKNFLITSYLSSAEYIEGEHKIKVCFDPKLKPYLLKIQGNFTQYQLKNAFNLKSTYSIGIYELIKYMDGIKTKNKIIEVKDLKEYLGIENNYKDFKDFEKYVLKVAEREITSYTDMNVSFTKIKKGRPIHAIEFHVSEKMYIKSDEEKFYEEAGKRSADEIRHRAKLPSSFSDKQIMEFYEIASERTDLLDHISRYEYMELNYIYTLKMNPSNKTAYYKKALFNDHADARKKLYEKYEL